MLKWALVLSFILHVALIVAAPASLSRPTKVVPPVYQVKLIEEQPPKPKPVVKRATPKPPPKPEPKLKAESPKKKPAVVPEVKKEPKKSRVTQKEKPKPPPPKEKPEPPPPAPPKPRPQPELETDTSLPEWYCERLRTTVWRNWQEPTGVMVGHKDIKVVVAFSILRSGHITQPTVTERSDDARLDLSALRAVFDSSPFPELPPEYEGDQLSVRFSFVYGEKTNAS